MSYESVLNITPAISANKVSSTLTTGLTGTLYLQTSGTTLGVTYTDLQAILSLATALTNPTLSSVALSAVALSATSTQNNLFVLSSVTVATTYSLSSQNYSTTLNYAYSGITNTSLTPNGTPLGNGDVVLGITISDSNFRTTALYLSAHGASLVFDPTQPSRLDNFFYLITVPGAATNNAIRTTSGQARLVQFMG
jgi:hypothetical protein